MLLVLLAAGVVQVGLLQTGEPYLSNRSEAIDYLIGQLVADSVYEETFPQYMSFSAESLIDSEGSLHFDITIREDHLPGSGGDPATAPVRGRFRVYFDGALRHFSPLFGMYVSYEEFLEERTEL